MQGCWKDYCVDDCESNASAECFCENWDTSPLMGIYDVYEPRERICPDEFSMLYDQTISQTVPWPEEEETEDDEDDEIDENDENNEDEEADDDSDEDKEEEEADDEEDKSDEEEDLDDDEEDGNDDEQTDGNAVQTQGDFDQWVRDQQISETDYYCNFEIKNVWHNGYFLWAGHNCDIYDLALKVLVPKDAWINRRTWTS